MKKIPASDAFACCIIAQSNPKIRLKIFNSMKNTMGKMGIKIAKRIISPVKLSK